MLVWMSTPIRLQCIRKVFRPLDFFHILLLYSLILQWIKKSFPLINLHTIPHNDKGKKVFFLFPLIILEMFLQLEWSPPVVNSIDWTWFGKAHTCLYKVPQLTVYSEQKPRHDVEGIVRRPPRQDCVEAQIWRRVPKHFCSIEGPQEHSGLQHS